MRQTKLLQMEISQEGRKEITSFWGITRHHPPTTLFAAVISLNNSWKQLLGVCIYTSAPLLTLGNGLMQSQFPKSFIPSRGKTSGLAAPLPDPAQPFNRKQDFGKCKVGSVRLGMETMSLWWVWSQGRAWNPLGEEMMLSLE